jgi:hypothetical protein
MSMSGADLSRTAFWLRVVHAGITGAFLAAIGLVWWSALTRRRGPLLRPAVVALLGEAAVVTVNRGDCPLGSIQRSAGDPVPLFELVLSPRNARRAIPVLGVVAAGGLALLAARRSVPAAA